MRLLWILLLGAGFAFAQEEGCAVEEEEKDEDIIVDGGAEEGSIDVEVDPFDHVAQEEDEPNRPAPVQVGTWQPPEITADARRELDGLVTLRSERPDDPGPRYLLAEFYLKHRWFPQAEAEFLSAAVADPDSIRPWEGLLRVYAERPRRVLWEERLRILQAGGAIVIDDERLRDEQDWLPSEREREKRITHAWSEIVKRRPDDVARRRLFLRHLKEVRDYARIEPEARAILARLPNDAETRFDLAEAWRRRAAQKEAREAGRGAADAVEAFRLLEENLRLNPDHAPSALRLSRMIAARDGTKEEARIVELEERAFLHLFLRPGLAAVPFRPDTLRLARDLAGPRLGNRLWDEAMRPPARREEEWDPFTPPDERPHYRRWLYLHFPNAQPRDRLSVFERLARRGDRDAAGILAAFLWHLEPVEIYPEEFLHERTAHQQVEDGAIAAAVQLGGAFYSAAERFLDGAELPHHRRRAARVARGLRDRRAVPGLLRALAWDTGEQESLGIAAALEEIGDPQAIGGLVEAALDLRRPLPRRVEAAEALAAFRDPRSAETLSRLREEQGFGLVTAYGLFRVTGNVQGLEDLKQALRDGRENPREVVRLLAKCDDPRVEEALLLALELSPSDARPPIIGLLRERYWASARDRVRAVLLREAESPAVTDFTLELLGEIGGEDVATRLLGLVEVLEGDRWAKAARALARTGDARAVRYFSRVRIVEKDPGRRRLASELYDEAAAREAERERAGKASRG